MVVADGEDFENRMKGGDVYRFGAGYVFYLRNTSILQRTKGTVSFPVLTSVMASDGAASTYFKSHFMTVSFFIGGGTNPVSVLSGFDAVTLANAFNVIKKLDLKISEEDLMTRCLTCNELLDRLNCGATKSKGDFSQWVIKKLTEVCKLKDCHGSSIESSKND